MTAFDGMFIIIIGSKTGNWKSLWDAGEHICAATEYAGINQESLANINYAH